MQEYLNYQAWCDNLEANGLRPDLTEALYDDEVASCIAADQRIALRAKKKATLTALQAQQNLADAISNDSLVA